MVYLNYNFNFVPYDAIVDTGTSFSVMNAVVCENLRLHVNPFSNDIPHYVGVEGASMVSSTVAVLGWVEVEPEWPKWL